MFAVLAIAGAVRFYQLGIADYWLDELHTLANSAGRRAEFESVEHGVILSAIPRSTNLAPGTTLSTVWRELSVDTHPPFYFLLVWGWRQLFGDGEWALRSLSALFSVLSLIPAAMILREYGRPWLGLAFALTLALSYSHIHMAQQARPYALAMFLLCMSYWSFTRLDAKWDSMTLRSRVGWSLVYGVATYLAVMTHYFTVLALLGQLAFVVVCGGRSFRRAWFALALGAGILFLVTWGRPLLEQLDVIGNQAWLQEQRSHPILRTVHRLLILPMRLLFTHTPFQTDVLLAFLGGAAVVAASVAVARTRRRESLLMLAWLLVPCAGFAAIEFYTHKRLLSHVRYPFIALPPLVGVLLLATEPMKRVVRLGAVGLCVLVTGLTLRLPTPVNPDNDRAAGLVAEQLRQGDLLVIDAIEWPSFWAARTYHNLYHYLPAKLSIPDPPVVLLRDQPDDALKAAMAAYDRIVVVSARLEEIPNPFPGQYVVRAQTGYVAQVGVIYLFERRAADVLP